MSKFFVFVAVALLAAGNAFASGSDNVPLNDGKHLNNTKFTDNWYLSICAGGVYSWGNYMSKADFADHLGAGGGIALGKQLSTAGDIRFGFYYNWNHGSKNPADYSKPVYDFHDVSFYADWLPNITNLICGYKENRLFTLSGVLGVGGTRTFNGDDDDLTNRWLWGARAGFLGDFRLNDKLHLTLEATNTFYDAMYDGTDNHHTFFSGHANLSVGLAYHFKNSDGSRKFTYVTAIPESKYDAINEEINNLRAQVKYKQEHPNIRVVKNVVETKNLTTYIGFAPKKSDIEYSQKPVIYTVSENAKKYDADVVYITRKTTDGNEELFNKRAEAVKKELVETYSVSESKVNIVSDASAIKVPETARNVSYIYIND